MSYFNNIHILYIYTKIGDMLQQSNSHQDSYVQRSGWCWCELILSSSKKIVVANINCHLTKAHNNNRWGIYGDGWNSDCNQYKP